MHHGVSLTCIYRSPNYRPRGVTFTDQKTSHCGWQVHTVTTPSVCPPPEGAYSPPSATQSLSKRKQKVIQGTLSKCMSRSARKHEWKLPARLVPVEKPSSISRAKSPAFYSQLMAPSHVAALDSPCPLNYPLPLMTIPFPTSALNHPPHAAGPSDERA